MSAMPDFPPPEFEPSGLGHDLLLDWAPWARDDRREEPSWSAEWSGRPRIDHEYGGDPPEDFWIVDKIVAPQRRDGTTYWHVASRFYLGEKSYAQITIDLGKNWPEKRVRFNLIVLRRNWSAANTWTLRKKRVESETAECGFCAPG
jgi:hypothetical protein